MKPTLKLALITTLTNLSDELSCCRESWEGGGQEEAIDAAEKLIEELSINMNSKHWLVTGHATDCEDETYYVVARSALKAENAVKAFILERMKEEDEDAETDPDEIYVTMTAELPGPPIRIHTESLEVVNPKPLQATA